MQMDETKIVKLLEALEEMNVQLQRMQLTCQQAEKELKLRLSEAWEIIQK